MNVGLDSILFSGSFEIYFVFLLCSAWAYLVLVYGLILWFIYLGFAEGVFMVVLVFFYVRICVTVYSSADLWLVWCLFDFVLKLV